MTGKLIAPRLTGEPRSWAVVLPRPSKQARPLRPDEMNASEQMFFYGAPLAHVVCYEEHLRTLRAEKAARDLLRGQRSLGAAAQLAALHAMPPLRESECLGASER